MALEAGVVLLRGAPGAGKSDLALRLIDRGGLLVADDQVAIRRQANKVWAAPPPALAGLLEIRGLGIVSMAHRDSAAIDMVIDLAENVERMPETAHCEICGLKLSVLRVRPFEASATIKIEQALKTVVENDDPGE